MVRSPDKRTSRQSLDGDAVGCGLTDEYRLSLDGRTTVCCPTELVKVEGGVHPCPLDGEFSMNVCAPTKVGTARATPALNSRKLRLVICK